MRDWKSSGVSLHWLTYCSFHVKSLLLLPLLLALCQVPVNAAQPNVLLIAVDDLNAWAGFMGGHPNAATPNMDVLARRGSVFLNAYCQAPICGPSRASLMTGLYPHTTGIYGHINDRDIRLVNEATVEAIFLPEYFRRHGYETLGVGKLFHQHAPNSVFDVSGGREAGFGPKPADPMNWKAESTQTDWGPFPATNEEMPDYRSAEWAIKQLQQERDKPFLLAVGFLRPHVPWHVPQEWFERHPLDKIQTPPYLPSDFEDIPILAAAVNAAPMMPTAEWAIEHDEWREITQAYLACVSFVDHCIGMVLEGLEESPYADNTIVVLWSDHGYQLGEKNRFAKHALWREATRVPMIIAGPNLPARQQISQPAGLIDLYPTLIELCQLPPNDCLEGKSLVPLIRNPALEASSPALTAYGRGNFAISSERFRYLRYEDGSEELYDLLTDPNEWNNLADYDQFQEIKSRLREFIPEHEAAWARDSSNPITDYFDKQKERLGVQAPVTRGAP